MMVQNSKFTVQLLEKIGAPLASAIESVPLKGNDTDVQAAKIMAQLLGQAVQISISLNTALNVVEDGAQADSTRLALASLAAPLLADFYRNNERVPEDQDIKRLVKSLESVVAFADNFSAAEDEKSRLTTMDHDAPLFDKTQSALVTMQAMTPVIRAVSDFAFGQSEAKLTQDVSAKLESVAQDVAKKISLPDKLSELMILKALANLYADCHIVQTQKLANDSNDDGARAELSLDPVWEAFGARVAMIEAVMGVEVPTETAAVSAVAPAVAATQAPSTEQPVAEAPTSAAASPASGPMGFFKKPDAQANANASTAMTPEAPVQLAQPPEAQANQQAQPVTPTPIQPPTETSADTTSNPPSNPMGFFKPGAKKPEEEQS